MSPRPDFEQLFRLLPNPYMVVDSQLRYVAANEAYLQVTGTRLADLLGKTVLDAFPNDPDDPNNASAQMLRRSFQTVLASGKQDTLALIPYRVYREAGSSTLTEERYWSATHTPLLDAQGQVAFIVQHTVDVTELQRLRQSPAVEQGVLQRAERVQAQNVELDAQRKKLLELFDQAPGFICLLRGERHVFELANQAYLTLVGRKDLVGKTVAEALPEVAGQGFLSLLDSVFRGGQPYVGTSVPVSLARVVGGPPEQRYVDFIYQPVRDAAGAVIGILVQGMDVTASQEARRAAEAFAEEMAQQSREVRDALESAQQRIAQLETELAKQR